MSPRRRAVIALLLVTTLAATLAGCENTRIGRRCRGTGFAQDATNVLQCRNGRWRVLMTKAQYVQLLIAIRNNSTTTTTTPPTPPTTTSTTTTTAPLPAPAYSIAGGYEHTCAVIAGTVKCVGRNNYGQLGNGSTTDSLTWVSAGITDATAVSSGSSASCALRTNGTAWCWGFGGLLGDGTVNQSTTPVQVVGVANAIQISAGPNGACALITGGRVRCWGSALMQGNSAGSSGLSSAEATITDVAQVAAGDNGACARRTDGAVWCWGRGVSGQNGDGTTDDALSPVQAIGISDAIWVTRGGFGGVSCAVRATGAVVCWGDDANHQMGDGNLVESDRLSPGPVSGIGDAVQVTSNFYATCALRSNGAVRCWGLGGYLGDGTATPSGAPVDVNGITGATRIEGEGLVTCALLSDNSAKCWGSNGNGQLGAGNTSSSPSPITVVGMP